ncbi:hypothetical protein V4F87_003277 [Vibrio parahaemolyticus]|nr:hypothetical protein [Vibrio parahaemolyticus]
MKKLITLFTTLLIAFNVFASQAEICTGSQLLKGEVVIAEGSNIKSHFGTIPEYTFIDGVLNMPNIEGREQRVVDLGNGVVEYQAQDDFGMFRPIMKRFKNTFTQEMGNYTLRGYCEYK